MIQRQMAMILCLCLGGCAHAPPAATAPVVQPVLVPLAQACAVDPGPRPDFPDQTAAILAAPNIFERAQLYAAGRQAHLDWEARLEAANAGCRATAETAAHGQ